ncbi:MAG: hypothetical protein GY913_25120 [Proteobacteria bacterium]|nr:hypothetical protein [Pseudomonadota bacterium]MCP4920195.1 hypothetical protein [Pseudomonadota bacterium]
MLVFSMLACSLNHGVRPVGKGNVAVTGSYGGPVIEAFGAPFPLPLSQVGVRYGVSDRSDVHAAFHPSVAGLAGLVGIDAGASYLIAPELGRRPAVVVDGTVSFFGGDTVEGEPEGGVRLYTGGAALASWSLGERDHLVYTGAELFWQPRPSQLYAAPVLGTRLMATRRVGVGLEAKWLQPWEDTEPLTAHFYSPGQHGAISAQLGLHITFGKGADE